MRTALEIVFWLAAGMIVWTQIGYAISLAVLARLVGRAPAAKPARGEPLPAVSLIVAAHDEQSVIDAKVANTLALDYPRELLEVIVTCDGCTDATAGARAGGRAPISCWSAARGQDPRAGCGRRAREGGDRGVLRRQRDVGARTPRGRWSGPLRRPRVGYACGQVRFLRPRARRGAPAATNQEGVYWRYEMAVRAMESRLSSITAGNGAIYATRRDTYIVVDPIMGHDLSFPFNMVKRGWRAVYVPEARASERMVPSIEGELARKRRMMSHTWPIVLRGGMLSPRGYPAGLCADDPLPPRAALPDARSCTRLRWPPTSRWSRTAGAGSLYTSPRSPCSWRCWSRPGSAGCLRVRRAVGVPATTCSPQRSLASACGTGCATAPPPRGKRRRDTPWLPSRVAPSDPPRRGHRGLGGPAGAQRPRAGRRRWRRSAWSPAGRALYRQRRVGRDGRPFEVLKLRTMVDGRGARSARGSRSTRTTRRITRVGALLRRTSLDELPNLLNVLRGEMSLIGPRPTLPVQVATYTPRQRGRLAVRPGITGWAQVNGRASLPWSERIELDLYYIEHRSLALDLRILWRTVAIVLGGSGLYKGETGGWKEAGKDG